jgi:hypothetical protein
MSAYVLRQLSFDPDSGGIGSIAQRKVDGVHQALAAFVEADALTHAVHGVAKGHVDCRVGKANRTSWFPCQGEVSEANGPNCYVS